MTDNFSKIAAKLRDIVAKASDNDKFELSELIEQYSDNNQKSWVKDHESRHLAILLEEISEEVEVKIIEPICGTSHHWE